MNFFHHKPFYTGGFRQLGTIAITTHLECLQQPAVLLLTLGGIVGTALIPLFQFHQFGEPGRLARDGALAYQLVLGLILAVVAAGSSLQREIDGGTASAALSKPLARDRFVVGKFLGVGLAVAHFWYSLLAAMLLAGRVEERLVTRAGEMGYLADTHAQAFLLLVVPAALGLAAILNHARRIRFCLATFHALLVFLTLGLLAAGGLDRAGEWNPAAANLDLRVVPVSLLILGALVIFTALATALATRLKAGATLVVCLLVLGLGLSVDALLAPGVPPYVALPARLLPNIQSFWLCDALADGGTLPGGYLAAALLYAGVWSVALLSLGVLAFRGRDIG